MNIETQIREILSRSYPVNDNRTQPAQIALKDKTDTCHSISIVGNHNIIISAELFLLETVLLVGFALFVLGR